jgi:chromosome segregation ATPase
MEPEQVEKRIAWLDEQHRKDTEAITRMSERIASVETMHATLSKQLQELSSEVTRQAAVSTRIHQMDETLARHRKDVSRQITELEERRADRDKAYDELRKTDQKAMGKSIDDFKADLGVIDEIKSTLELRREEEIRLNKKMGSLEKQLGDVTEKGEDIARGLVSVEDGRKQDIQRIAELQSDTAEQRVKSDTMQGEMDLMQDQLRRFELRISELVAGDNERRELQTVWVEKQDRKIMEFERSWKDWEKRFTEFETKAGDLDERIITYEETHRSLKQMQSELEETLERLERRINEVTEMQRLAEDRMKHEWSSFQADDQKRSNTMKLTTDERWREHHRQHEKYETKMQMIEENVGDVIRMTAESKEGDRQRALALFEIVRDWLSETE